MTHDPLQCVASAPIFTGLPQPIIAQLASISTHQQRRAKGELLYAAGDAADRLLVVDTGRVKVFRSDASGNEQILYFLTGHAIDSEAALFTAATHQNSAMALTDTLVCSIARQDFQTLVASSPALAVALLSAFGHRLTALENHSARYGTLTAHDRLLRYLQDTAATIGSDYFRLPMTKRDLASWLAITPETLSRQFTALRHEGLIDVQGQMIRLL